MIRGAAAEVLAPRVCGDSLPVSVQSRQALVLLMRFFSVPPEDGYVRMFLRGRPITMHVPDQQRESFILEQKVALPEKKLKLQWVYPSTRQTQEHFRKTVSPDQDVQINV